MGHARDLGPTSRDLTSIGRAVVDALSGVEVLLRPGYVPEFLPHLPGQRSSGERGITPNRGRFRV